MPHHIPIIEVARANLAIALTLVWSGVAACVVAAVVFDVGRWLALRLDKIINCDNRRIGEHSTLAAMQHQCVAPQHTAAHW